MKIYIDGLERSGNTFLGGAIGYAFGIETIPLWSHKIETLKNRDKQYPFIVPVRDAIDSLASGKIYKDYAIKNGLNKHNTGVYEDIELVLKRYKEYTDYLLEHEDLFIAPFKEFTRDNNAVMEVIAKTYNISVIQHMDGLEIINLVGENPDVDNPYTGNFPRESVPEKEEARNFLLSNYKDEIDAIQSNIDKLYERYYERAK